MPEQKISGLPAVVTPLDSDQFETNQGGVSKRETRAQIVTGLALDSDLTVVETDLANHIANADVHLTADQNTLLDGLAATLTAAELNFVDGVTSAIQTQLDSKSPLASPTFTGVPAAPTAAPGNSTTQLATTAFVDAHITDAAGAHAGSAISNTPAGSIVATDVQAAINELDSTKVSNVAGTINTLDGAYTFTNNVTLSGAVLQGGSPLVFEGALDNASETTLEIDEPTADRTITLPDTSGTVALTNDITDFQQFVGIESIILHTGGTWTATRIAQGDIVKRKTAAAASSIICIDATPIIRTAASKGFKLTSFDVIYKIETADLNAHSVTLTEVEYSNGAPVSAVNVAITGALAVSVNANPFVTNVTVDAPAFQNIGVSKYVIEITVDAALTSDYDFYGVNLKFTGNYF